MLEIIKGMVKVKIGTGVSSSTSPQYILQNQGCYHLHYISCHIIMSTPK